MKDNLSIRDASVQENQPMARDTHYLSGDEIRAGDHVEYADSPGQVVFVLGTRSFAPGFAEEDWSYLKRGFMLDVQGMGLLFQEEADEDLTLIKRG
jgi:hypothetical protein